MADLSPKVIWLLAAWMSLYGDTPPGDCEGALGHLVILRGPLWCARRRFSTGAVEGPICLKSAATAPRGR